MTRTRATTTPTSKTRRSAKRANGEGSVTQLANGLWQTRITLEDGRRKAFYGKTRQEAAQKLTAALRDRDRGLPTVSEKQTVGRYLVSWLDAVQPTIRPRTHKRYAELMTLHAIPALGKTSLAKLTAQHVQTLYAAKLAAGLSPTTVRHLATVLHGALAQAERLGLVARNPASLVDPPRNAETEMHVLTPEQVQSLLRAVQGDRLEALYVVAVSTGMRQGELLALRWRDVDLTGGTLAVRATCSARRRKAMSSPPQDQTVAAAHRLRCGCNGCAPGA